MSDQISITYKEFAKFCSLRLKYLLEVEEQSGVSMLFPVGEKQLASLPPASQNCYILWALLKSGFPGIDYEQTQEVFVQLFQNGRFPEVIEFATGQYRSLLKAFEGPVSVDTENPTQGNQESNAGDGSKPLAA